MSAVREVLAGLPAVAPYIEVAPSGCWEWQRARTVSGGYGVVWLEGRLHRVHRLVMQATIGHLLRPDEHVLHHCDNPPCCNPDHLFLGTNADNIADRVAKGRSPKGDESTPRRYRDRFPRGEDRTQAKLTNATVLEIRRLADTGLYQREIAEQFGISRRLVGMVIRGERWAHVQEAS